MSSFNINGEPTMCSSIRWMIENELRLAEQAEESNIHQKNLSAELEEQRELIQNAAKFTEDFIWQVIRNNLTPINCIELITLLTIQFGFSIRLHLWDIIEQLKENSSEIGDFAKWNFQDDALRDALLGKDEKQKAKDESTLDELFARTLQLRSTDKFKEVIKFVAALREYSPFNNMLVKLQRPDAQYYATASHWKKKFERDVKPEAIPIVILRPMGPVMLVYDVDDTTGKKLPPQIEDPFSISGEFDTEFYYQTLLSCQKIGIEIREVNLTKSHAGTAIRESQETDIKLIVQLNQNHDVKVRYATLCHELAHLFLGHLGGDPYGKEWSSRIGLTLTQRELEAEAVSYMLCVRAGLISNSAEYLSGYLQDPEDLKQISIEAIIKTVTYIETLQTRIFRPRKSKNSKNNK